MLSRLLDGHPQIASFPYEPRFGKIDKRKHRKLSEGFPDPLVGSIEDVLRRHGRFERSVRIVSGASPSKSVFPDYDEQHFRAALRRELPPGAGPKEFIEAYAGAFFSSHRYYRDRWDKINVVAWHSSKSHFWSEDLLGIKDLHLVYIVRHPLDVLASYLRLKGEKSQIVPEMELLCWCDSVLRAAVYQQRSPERVTVVRYEDMVSDVAAFAQQLASRLDVSYCEQMSQPSLLGQAWAGNGSFQGYQAVSPHSVGRFDGFLSASQISHFAEVIEGWFEPLGYSLEAPYFGPDFSLQAIVQERDPFQLLRDYFLYYETLIKEGSLDAGRTGSWADHPHARKRPKVPSLLKKKAQSLFGGLPRKKA